MQMSQIYHAYQFIHSYCNDPFTILQPEALFHASLFLQNSLTEFEPPAGVSRGNTMYTLAKQAAILGTNDLARFAYSQMQSLKYAKHLEDTIELEMMMIQV